MTISNQLGREKTPIGEGEIINLQVGKPNLGEGETHMRG
jgi:hypothetical protein